jgi:uncharacterized protein YceK
MRLMSLVLLLALCLGGCASPVRQLNAGASGPWKVTMSTIAKTDADYAGPRTPGLTTVAWCDHAALEMRISSDRARSVAIGDSWHELGHKLEREYPRIWEILDALDAPGFPCGSDAMHAAQRAARQVAQ